MTIWGSIGKIAKHFGVTTQTIRNWTKSGKLDKPKRTLGGHRRYNLEKITGQKERKTIAYSRVSSADQKADLKRQAKEVKKYCEEKKYETIEEISDIGSGINYKKRGIKKVIKEILQDKVQRIVIAYEDRLLRFGMEIIRQICKLSDIVIEVIYPRESKNFEEELTLDVLTILTVYCSKIYGRRSHEKRRKKHSNNELSNNVG